jgi:predicted membrane protein
MNTRRFIFGIIIIAIGALFLLNSTGIANVGGLTKWWPSLIILLGVWRLIANRFRNLFGPLLLIAIGVILQLWQLDAFGLSFGVLWPAIVIVAGIAILAGGFRRRGHNRRRRDFSPVAPVVVDVEDTHNSDEDHTLNAVLCSDSRRVSGDFQRGSINVVMGSGSLDLRNARIVDKPATLDVSVVMGEVKVCVPDEWSVRFDNTTQMGESKDTRGNPRDTDTPDLITGGSVTMGSLQITD